MPVLCQCESSGSTTGGKSLAGLSGRRSASFLCDEASGNGSGSAGSASELTGAERGFALTIRGSASWTVILSGGRGDAELPLRTSPSTTGCRAGGMGSAGWLIDCFTASMTTHPPVSQKECSGLYLLVGCVDRAQ